MQDDKYSVSQYSVNTILSAIESGDIAIPEIQRPFVWKGPQVRDLIDSLYNGFPTGYLIIWQSPSVRLKDGRDSLGKKILIDGQQRVTALMTALAGHSVLTNDYQEKKIIISFNPLAKDDEERFAVQTPAHLKSSVWIDDISEIFKPGFDSFSFVTEYVQKNPGTVPAKVNDAISKLLRISSCQLGVIGLVPELSIDLVTEIFVRINSQGKRLNEADFAMSKIASDDAYGGRILRKAIDYFCHTATDPSFFKSVSESDKEFAASGYVKKMEWLRDFGENIYSPTYSDMMRVSFMHQFNRARLSALVSLLSGRDFDDRTYKESIAAESFAKLTDGVNNFINEYNFKQFVLAITSAGFITPKLINSKISLDFAYTLFLMLRNNPEFEKTEIKHWVQKWFVLSTLTSRYAGATESQMDRDLRSIATKGFKNFLAEIEETQLNESYWNIALPQALESASDVNPVLKTYFAAQIYFNDRSLLSNSCNVGQLLSAGDVHHIFPKQYLKKSGIIDKSRYNQVANYTYLDTPINIAIGDKAPNVYFNEALNQCKTGEGNTGTIFDEEAFWSNLECNAIPKEVLNMKVEDFNEFLRLRRQMMAKKIRKYYEAL